MRLTKQGVRNLDDIKGKPAGRRLPMPPKGQERATFCNHRERYEVGDGRWEKCAEPYCGAYIEVDWS